MTTRNGVIWSPSDRVTALSRASASSTDLAGAYQRLADTMSPRTLSAEPYESRRRRRFLEKTEVRGTSRRSTAAIFSDRRNCNNRTAR